jgi:putative phosphoesterase
MSPPRNNRRKLRSRSRAILPECGLTLKIGVISDTHNHFDPRIPSLFAGVDHILHAGDIGLPWVIMELESIASVTAVLGNNDSGLSFNETECLELDGRKFLVHHIVDAHRPAEPIRQRIAREKPDVVVFGHSHKPFNEVIGNTLYFNPGYAGKPRFNLSRSVAVVHCGKNGITAEYHTL